MDRAVMGSLGPAGIGVHGLCDHDGKIIMQLFKSIVWSNPALAELLAIREACYCLLLYKRNVNVKVVLESDCNNDIQWIKSPALAPTVFKIFD
ncbi:hypothetical protein V6N12_030880 [Hibiscus sabdariffa]|uniref:RNase H type-1 domain-containing protein n=1 Tax=Hibiscus sabdariffa TaxID=183260 RepID=A0ABR2E7A8_9ROSI